MFTIITSKITQADKVYMLKEYRVFGLLFLSKKLILTAAELQEGEYISSW